MLIDLTHTTDRTNLMRLICYIVCLIALIVVVPAVYAQQLQPSPGVALQGPDHYTFRVGDVEVIALSDGTVPQDLHALLQGTNEANTDALLRNAFQTNPVEASINVFLFRLAGHLILVDAGSGDFFGRGCGGKLLESLAAVKVAPEQVTDVLVTHAHYDHMGGLVHKGKLTFPNATVHIGQADVDFFLDRSNSQLTHYDMSYFDKANTALKPDLDAGKVKGFRETTEILPGIRATLHPGHTPGSAFYTLVSAGQSIVFVGDIIHVAAVQAPAPEVTITYDVDPVQAASVRKEAFADFANERTLVAVPHLPFPGVGHLRTNGTGFEWVPITYGNR